MHLLSKNAINNRWVRHLTSAEERESFKQSVSHLTHTAVFKRLVDIVEEELQKIGTDQSDFSTPEWAYKQAYLLGEKSGLTKILSLLKQAKEESQ